MFVLDLVNNCSNPALANLFNIAKRFINILQIIVPILAIFSVIINLVKSVQNPDDKKGLSPYKNIFIALVMVFAIPVIVDTTMNLLGENYTISSCWNNSSNVSTGGNSTYKPVNNKKPSGSVNPNPSDYDKGSTSNNKSNNSSNSNSSSSNNSSSSSTSASNVIMLGDSRCVQMEEHIGTNKNIWSCKSSMGLDWMKSTGVPNIESKIKKDSKIVIMMGVNDLYQIDAYITYINQKATEWAGKGAKTYFVSVNPVEGSYNSLSNQIVDFNNKLQSSLNKNVRYINTHSYLKSGGFSTTDGLHYTKETSKKIYNYIMNNI